MSESLFVELWQLVDVGVVYHVIFTGVVPVHSAVTLKRRQCVLIQTEGHLVQHGLASLEESVEETSMDMTKSALIPVHMPNSRVFGIVTQAQP